MPVSVYKPTPEGLIQSAVGALHRWQDAIDPYATHGKNLALQTLAQAALLATGRMRSDILMTLAAASAAPDILDATKIVWALAETYPFYPKASA